MNLRRVVLYNNKDRDSEEILQSWNEKDEIWEDVPLIRCVKDDDQYYEPPFKYVSEEIVDSTFYCPVHGRFCGSEPLCSHCRRI